MKKTFLITIIIKDFSDNKEKVFHVTIDDYDEAKNYYDQQLGYLIQETVDKYHLGKNKYIASIESDYENNYFASASDPDKEWSIFLEQTDIEEKEEPSVTRLEILLENAIDLLAHAGYEGWELRQELGLTDEEFEKYAREFYPEEEE